MIKQRPEKETDPKKYPGQTVNKPTHVGTLKKEIEDWEREEEIRKEYDRNTFTREDST